jgi:ribosomal protein L34E
MKFSHSGYCQDCQQRVEFIRRERPEVVAKLQNKFQEVAV